MSLHIYVRGFPPQLVRDFSQTSNKHPTDTQADGYLVCKELLRLLRKRLHLTDLDIHIHPTWTDTDFPGGAVAFS